MINELSSWCVDGSGNVRDLVGIVTGRLPIVYGSGYRLGAEYAINGTWSWVVGGGNSGKYIQVSTSVAPGLQVSSAFASTPGGTQYEEIVAVIYWDTPTPGWWFYFNGTYFGYIPLSDFSVLGTTGCIVNHYGEAFDSDSLTTTWMDADMGSGVFPTGTTVAANFGTRAFIRGTRYYAAKNAGLMTSTTGAAYASDTACYRALRTTDWGGGLESLVDFWWAGWRWLRMQLEGKQEL